MIFGCGGVGRKCKAYLEEQGIEVLAFVDNDKSKWGGIFEGIRIIPPTEIPSLTYQRIAIGNYKAADSIKEQLIKMGVDEGKIIVPFRPCRVFKNESIPVTVVRESQDMELETGLTRWYRNLGVEVTDDALLDKLQDLKSVLHEYNIPRNEVCVVSGAVLQVLGLRESKNYDDVDIIMTSPFRELYGDGLVIVSETCEMHRKDEYDVADDEIVINPEYHFCYCGLKFMDPKILYRHIARKGIQEELRLLDKFFKEQYPSQ